MSATSSRPPSGGPPDAPATVLPAAVLDALVRRDSAAPRVTFYDDAPGPTRGERIELSARVLANWVSKAGNALQEELDAGPGTTVLLALPAHWRALYWALAAWSVGAVVHVVPDGHPEAGQDVASYDLVVTDDPDLAEAADRAVLVRLAMLSRGSATSAPTVMDEARELSTYGDVFEAWEAPDPTAPGLVVHRGATATGPAGTTPSPTTTPYVELAVPRVPWGEHPRVLLAGGLDAVLLDALAAWAAGGSVVLVREAAQVGSGEVDGPGDQAARIAAEGVTVDARTVRRHESWADGQARVAP